MSLLTIHRIYPDPENCQMIVPADDSWRDTIAFDGSCLESNWNPPKFVIRNPENKASAFYLVAPGAIAMTPEMRFHPILAMFYEMAGELLPINLINGEKLFILNVTECVNALDVKRAIISIDAATGRQVVQKYEFRPERLSESTIFKVPASSDSEMLVCKNRYAGPDDEFLPTFVGLKIPGLIAEQIWCGENVR
ncbi:hypothetical protein BH09VER1_BH09VER1_23960 [soil metagenome]